MLDCSLIRIGWPITAGHGLVYEAEPPEYTCRRESRPNPATLDVDIADTGERQIRLVGSFPEARLVFGEVTENPCVRRGCPSRMSVTDVRHRCPSQMSVTDCSVGSHTGGL